MIDGRFCRRFIDFIVARTDVPDENTLTGYNLAYLSFEVLPASNKLLVINGFGPLSLSTLRRFQYILVHRPLR